MERGFTRLAYCGLPATPATVGRQSSGRFSGWARQAGLPAVLYRSLRHGPALEELQAELSAWIASLPKPIGLMACNDLRARHVLEACRAVGVRVPEDVAVIGVDNDEIICELTDPPLSSVEQGGHRLGYQAAMMLEQIMRGRRVSRQRPIRPSRASGQSPLDGRAGH